MTGVVRFRAFPQGLKPVILMRLRGTAKAVPFQNPVMKQLLDSHKAQQRLRRFTFG